MRLSYVTGEFLPVLATEAVGRELTITGSEGTHCEEVIGTSIGQEKESMVVVGREY